MLRVILLTCLFFTTPAIAYDQKGSAWNTTSVQGKFADSPFTWSAEIQPHLKLTPFPVLEQVEHFGTVGMKFDYDLATSLGAGWLSSFGEKIDTLSEARTYVQGSYTPTFAGVTLALRERLEERFFATKPFSLRSRTYLKVSYAALDWLSFSVADELFFAASADKSFVPGFDQDRVSLGMKFKVNKNFAVETGYQPIFTAKGVDHVGVLNTQFTVD